MPLQVIIESEFDDQAIFVSNIYLINFATQFLTRSPEVSNRRQTLFCLYHERMFSILVITTNNRE